MDYWLWIVVVGLGIVAILFFSRQISAGFNVLRNIVLGIMGILVCNILLTPIGVSVGVNLMTMFIAGILGIPGIFLLYLTQWMVS